MNLRYVFILLVIGACPVSAQTTDSLKVDTNEFGCIQFPANIFGCSCCDDTIQDEKRVKKIKIPTIYVLLENRTILAAYKQGKELWRVDARELFDFPGTRITCMDLRYARSNSKGIVTNYRHGCFYLGDCRQDRSLYMDMRTRKVISNKRIQKGMERHRKKWERTFERLRRRK